MSPEGKCLKDIESKVLEIGYGGKRHKSPFTWPLFQFCCASKADEAADTFKNLPLVKGNATDTCSTNIFSDEFPETHPTRMSERQMPWDNTDEQFVQQQQQQHNNNNNKARILATSEAQILFA